MPHAPGCLLSRLLIMLGLWGLTACASTPPADRDASLIERMMTAEIVLLGELHDNVTQHRLRLQWLRELADRAPITIVLEHLDADIQPRLEQARLALDPKQSVEARARELAEAAGFRFDGWDWALIGPVIGLALERNIPLQAANLSSREAFAIARGQAHPLASMVPRGWSAEVERSMAQSIRDGHCGLLPEAMIPAMVLAQRARDARLAEAVMLARASGRKAVLLAGNGHVRSDLGVPLHLRDRGAQSVIFSVGLLEASGSQDAGLYDAVRITEAQIREDPCEALRRRFGAAK